MIALWIILAILALIAVLAVILLIRTAGFKPKVEEKKVFEDVLFDGDAAVHSLGELVKCKTVSYEDHSLEDDAEFKKLEGMLPELFPNVYKTCTLIDIPDRALLYRWKGKKDSGKAAVLMAHYDVVPVEEENWTVPAFEALIKDGVMWGRGTVDTKVSFNGILSAAENLIAQGFQPEEDVYFAFSGGEEVHGEGAKNIVKYFQEKGIELTMVVDEGGAVVENIFPGVKEPCGLIGIAEKGFMNLTFSVNSSGGHASAPGPHTPVGILSKACTRLEENPFPVQFTKPVLEMFDVLGRRSTFLYRLIFSNLWLFKPVLDSKYKKEGGTFNALIRTTVAFTQMDGSLAPNVIPPTASMVANLRISPAESVKDVLDYIRKTINDDSITLSDFSMEPSRISTTDCVGWERVKNAVEGTWKGSVVAPYLMVQCSDSANYGVISDKVFRFSAVDLLDEERASIHGNDEHLRLEAIKHAVEFFIRVMKQC